MKLVEIIISPRGEARLETKGFTGAECRAASNLLEAALGRTTSETLTSEFHETNSHQQNQLHEET